VSRDEYLRRAAAITQAWNLRYADRIETAYPAGSHPHDGVNSDYAQHHAIMSAPPEYDDILNEKLLALTLEYQAGR
jgi:hypothetical protein